MFRRPRPSTPARRSGDRRLGSPLGPLGPRCPPRRSNGMSESRANRTHVAPSSAPLGASGREREAHARGAMPAALPASALEPFFDEPTVEFDARALAAMLAQSESEGLDETRTYQIPRGGAGGSARRPRRARSQQRARPPGGAARGPARAPAGDGLGHRHRLSARLPHRGLAAASGQRRDAASRVRERQRRARLEGAGEPARAGLSARRSGTRGGA